MIFEINGKDYADHVLSGAYKINSKPLAEEIVDANGRTHKRLIANKVSGSVDMFFRTIEEFDEFATWIEGHKDRNLANKIELTVNNTANDVLIDAYIDYEPVRSIDGMWNDYILRYSMNITER